MGRTEGPWAAAADNGQRVTGVTDRPRLVASDLDGTLLDPAGTVTARTRAALLRMHDLGIETVLVTARPPRWIDHLADVVGGHGVAICANGAYVYDVHSRRVIESVGLEPGTVHAVAADLRAALPGVSFAAELPDGVHFEQDFTRSHPEWTPKHAVYAPIDAVDRPVGKFLARHSEMEDGVFFEHVRRIVGERAHIAYSGAVGLAEMGPPGVSKATTLARWCAGRGIAAEQVWAFGDMPNDLPMLHWAGVSFAVANAHPDVRAAATHACGSNAEDGVAGILERIDTDRGTPRRGD